MNPFGWFGNKPKMVNVDVYVTQHDGCMVSAETISVPANDILEASLQWVEVNRKTLAHGFPSPIVRAFHGDNLLFALTL